MNFELCLIMRALYLLLYSTILYVVGKLDIVKKLSPKLTLYDDVCNHLNGCDVYSTWNVPPILPFLSHVSYPLSSGKMDGQHTRWKIPIFFGGLYAGETSRHDKSSERSFPHLLRLDYAAPP